MSTIGDKEAVEPRFLVLFINGKERKSYKVIGMLVVGGDAKPRTAKS
jgi:hypothetical protein